MTLATKDLEGPWLSAPCWAAPGIIFLEGWTTEGGQVNATGQTQRSEVGFEVFGVQLLSQRFIRGEQSASPGGPASSVELVKGRGEQ